MSCAPSIASDADGHQSELLERGTECHGLDGWLRACVESFTAPWTVVRYNYAPTALEPGTTTNLSSGATMTSPMPLVSSTRLRRARIATAKPRPHRERRASALKHASHDEPAPRGEGGKRRGALVH